MRSESTSALGQPRETNPIFGLLLFRIALALLGSRKTREGQPGEHVARLALHLLLELREHLLALLHVRLHQALHGRPLQAYMEQSQKMFSQFQERSEEHTSELQSPCNIV